MATKQSDAAAMTEEQLDAVAGGVSTLPLNMLKGSDTNKLKRKTGRPDLPMFVTNGCRGTF